MLVVGNPLAGKTRAILRALKSLKKRACVLVPGLVDIRPEEFVIPGAVETFSNPIVVLDDIDKFAARQNFDYMFGEFKKKDMTIVATCRSGDEFERFCKGNERIVETFKEPIEIPREFAQRYNRWRYPCHLFQNLFVFFVQNLLHN